jgi:CheY-like chemotaxis protein
VKQKAAGMADTFKPLPGVHVLIVEDNEDSRYLLTDVLQYCGALVTSVSSAEEARALLGRVRPDILVSDLAMPGLDGYALIKWVRALSPERGGRIPAIAITAFSEDYDSRRALGAGFDAYLRKPINLTSFCELVGDLAAARRPDEIR